MHAELPFAGKRARAGGCVTPGPEGRKNRDARGLGPQGWRSFTSSRTAQSPRVLADAEAYAYAGFCL